MKNFIKILSLVIIAVILTSCGDMSQNGLTSGGDDDSTKEQLTRIGNPGAGMPDLPKVVKDYLTGYPIWKSSLLNEGDRLEDLLVYNFDMDNMKVSVEGLSDITQIFNVNILKDGSIIAEGNSEFKLSGFYNPISETYKVDLGLVSKTGVTVSSAFATTSKDIDKDFENRVAMCKKTATKCFDAGTDLIGNARYHVSTFIQTTAPDSYECGLMLSDTCAVEGKVLTEVICKEDSLLGYVTRNVECDCHNGKCTNQISDKPMKILESDGPSFCQQYPDFCQVMNNPAAMTASTNPTIGNLPLNQINQNSQGVLEDILEGGVKIDKPVLKFSFMK